MHVGNLYHAEAGELRRQSPQLHVQLLDFHAGKRAAQSRRGKASHHTAHSRRQRTREKHAAGGIGVSG